VRDLVLPYINLHDFVELFSCPTIYKIPETLSRSGIMNRHTDAHTLGSDEEEYACGVSREGEGGRTGDKGTDSKTWFLRTGSERKA